MIRRLLLTLVPLVLILAVGLTLVLRNGDGPDGGERLLGGPLLTLDLVHIQQILVTENGRQHRLVRGEGIPWSLRGALHDWVDPRLLAFRLDDLSRAEGGAVLAGTEPEDRRYEFNGPDAVRLVIRHEDGREVRLALGATNPVTGHVYGSGAGRPGCFPVRKETRDLIEALPQSVRVQTLLPPIDPESLDAIELVWGGRQSRLRQESGRWWLEVAGPDDSLLPALARAYSGQYDDRWRSVDGVLAIQARRETVELLIHDVSATPASQVVPLDYMEEARTAWGLDRTWRRVTFVGPGVDPDPAADDADRMGISFAEPLDATSVGATRRGQPVLGGKTPLQSLELSLSDFVDVRALTLQVMDADTVMLAGVDGPLLRAAHDRTRTGRFDGREEWKALPPLSRLGSEEDAQTTARFFVVELDRLATAAVLPPTSDRRVLQDDERLRLTIVWNDPPHREEYEVGVLAPQWLPAGAPPLVEAPKDPGPVGLWRPADGRLLQIPSGLVITGRNLARRD